MKKANDPKTVEALKLIIRYIRDNHPDLQLIAEPSIVEELDELSSKGLLAIDRGKLPLGRTGLWSMLMHLMYMQPFYLNLAAR